MFGLEFLFAAGLWALPLAGLPVLLHLLLRQKSPIVQFSTLRFVKLSVQRTAARRRLQKWLLLACRVFLIALLIWAIAQPAKKLTGNWFGTGRSMAAAIVVDTSYSLQLQDAQLTLLSKADGMVQDLLRDQLAGAKVAIFQSSPVPNRTEELQDAAGILAEWSPLKPQANPRPLVERVGSAISLLERQPADQKWLIVLSDFQANEFGRSISPGKDMHTALIDLHPADVRSAGVTKLSMAPEQPIPGVASEAVVEITGRAGDWRAVALKTATVDGAAISQYAPVMANFDAGGRAIVRFPLKLAAQRWVMLTAQLTADDDMMWDNQRSELIEIPPAQSVTILSDSAGSRAARFVRLVLDPSEGRLADWPLKISASSGLSGRENVAVAILSKWPDAPQAAALRDFAQGGKNVILFLHPGLEDSWDSLPSATKGGMLELLPSVPAKRAEALRRAAVADARDPLLEGLTDEKYQLSAITVRQLVGLTAQGPATTVLNAMPVDPTPGSRPAGLLFRKPVGSGICYTIATSPEGATTNFATHPTFLPLLVRMALAGPARSHAANVELGQPLVLDGSLVPAESEMSVRSPLHEEYRLKAVQTKSGRAFVFADATEPGVYQWRKANDDQVVAMTNVQLPAAESDLTYRPAAALASGDVVVATSLSDLQAKLGKLSEPQPQWSMPIAIVLLLLCFEALMGSVSKIWRPPALRAFMPTMSKVSV